MKTITTHQLVTVTGGASKNDAVTQQLSSLQSSIKDLASSRKNNAGGGDTMTMMMMMLALRPQPSQAAVVAAPAAPGPIVNISTRFRR